MPMDRNWTENTELRASRRALVRRRSTELEKMQEQVKAAQERRKRASARRAAARQLRRTQSSVDQGTAKTKRTKRGSRRRSRRRSKSGTCTQNVAELPLHDDQSVSKLKQEQELQQLVTASVPSLLPSPSPKVRFDQENLTRRV